MRDYRDAQERDAMTGNQRRPGFRLPWSAEQEPKDAAESDGDSGTPEQDTASKDAADAPDAGAANATGDAPEPGTTREDVAAASEGGETAPAESTAAPESSAPSDGSAATDSTSPTDETPPAEAVAPPADAFLKELVDAMRTVADNARDTNLAELRVQADARTQRLAAESEGRVAALRSAADADVAGVADWAAAEAERIRVEAERRVAERKSRLEEELAAEAQRSAGELSAMRARLTDYERELTAFHAQLSEIGDPAAFAAAAKRIPSPPLLGPMPIIPAPSEAGGNGNPTPDAVEAPASPANGPASAAADSEPAEGDTPAPPSPASLEPDNSSLAERLAELDALLEPPSGAPEAPTPTPEASPATESDAPAAATAAAPASEANPAAAPSESEGVAASTAVVVRGLSSFGAITGFRQSLAAADGVDNVNLSLGPTGEFLYRATHATGFDLADAIRAIEGDQAVIEKDESGTLHVTISRGR